MILHYITRAFCIALLLWTCGGGVCFSAFASDVPAALLSQSSSPAALVARLAGNPHPPASPVKLIFIHHSTGGNWLADPNPDQPAGALGRALMQNNYFVSATNYGWGPYSIGDRTDIPNWPEWFTGPERATILSALYAETGQNFGGFGWWPRLAQDPGGENQIILFKSCYPNSDLYGQPNDPPALTPNDQYTVHNAKAVYNNLLTYFRTRQDKLFVVITAPPMGRGEYLEGDQSPAQRAANARALNDWLVNDWLDGYPYRNVAVFDYYNVLTSNGSASRVDDPETNGEPNDAGWADGNHHRWWNGAEQHIQTVGNDYSAYPTDTNWDSHPTSAGQQKATAEFVDLLNVFYNRWIGGAVQPTATATGIPPTLTATPTATRAPYTSTPTKTPTLRRTGTPLTFHLVYLPIILKRLPGPSPTPTSTPPVPIPSQLIQPTDLVYEGAFRLPDGLPEIGWEWNVSASAMAYYPDGDPHGPIDGYPGSIFGTGHDFNQYVSEISIPVPVNSPGKNVGQLNTAMTLQEFHNIRGNLFPELEIPRVGLEYLPAQGAQATGKLYFCWAQHMGEGDTNPSHGWCELDLSNPQTAGPWRIGDYWNYVTTDYIFAIPRAWADANTPGMYLATGRFRDGGQGGQGPSVLAYGPWNHGNPPAAGTTLPAVPLLLYGNAYTPDSPRMNNYHHSDEWSGAAWLTAGDKAAVIFVGTKGTGDCWYGCADGTVWPDEPPFPPECPERGWWSTGFVGQIIFYDPADLAAVARGETETWAPQPYATLNIDQNLYHVVSSQQKEHVGAASFDRQRGLLYVFEPLADGDKSLIHVWRVSG